MKSSCRFLKTFIFILIFPLIISFLYDTIPCPVLSITLTNLLDFYGAAFSVLGAFYIYLREVEEKEKNRAKEQEKEQKQKEEQKERQREKRKSEIMQGLEVEVVPPTNGKKLFYIKITRKKDLRLHYVYLYDEFFATNLRESYKIPVTFMKKVEEAEPEARYNFTMDEDILDADGYPKYVQIVCKDVDGNAWVCDFNKNNNSGKMYYPPQVEMV
ncbi:MAG: hypothetical protein HFI72_04575 [Peptococcaceae bacterium]|nr:hypothetical protein [Peptococcaceae bacterium]